MNRAPVAAIISCYCCASSLDRAVQSVALQTVPPAELWLIEDASPDGGLTWSAMEQATKRYSGILDIRLIRSPINLGPAGARNLGWHATRQPYVAFLDSDDSWHRKKLEVQYGWMSAHPEVVLTGHRMLRPGVAKDQNISEPIPTTMLRRCQLLLTNPLSTPSVMIRNDIDLRFEPGKRYSEDYLLWLQIVLTGHAAAKIEVPLGFLHKAPWGEAGLSANLWAMERAELANYRLLQRQGLIDVSTTMGLQAWSMVKCVRRCMVALCRKMQRGRALST